MNEELHHNISKLSDHEIRERILAKELTREAYLIACKILKERDVEIPITDNYAPSNSYKKEKFLDSVKTFYKKHPYWSLWIVTTILGLILKVINHG
jgi:hypothetical protein